MCFCVYLESIGGTFIQGLNVIGLLLLLRLRRRSWSGSDGSSECLRFGGRDRSGGGEDGSTRQRCRRRWSVRRCGAGRGGDVNGVLILRCHRVRSTLTDCLFTSTPLFIVDGDGDDDDCGARRFVVVVVVDFLVPRSRHGSVKRLVRHAR